MNSKRPPNKFPRLRIGSLAHIYADPPDCQYLEGPALLIECHGNADREGFEAWSVVFSNSTRRELRLVHPFDLIFTLGPAAEAAAAPHGKPSPVAAFCQQGGSHHE